MRKRRIRKAFALLLTAALVLNMGLISARATETVITLNVTEQCIAISQNGDYRIVGTTTTNTVIVEDGVTANITLDDASIDVSTINKACAFLLVGDATVYLTLAEGSDNTLKSGEAYAGLQVASVDSKTATLTIGGTGSLNATGGMLAAGIGGGDSGDGGSITIGGGEVTATGGFFGAGIGGGDSGDGGSITIGGGEVKAMGGENGAGIGGGNGGEGDDITIDGGTVTATGGNYAAGIGGGDSGDGGTIIIKNGTVEAKGGIGGAGIGGGTGGGSGSITIDGDNTKVEASGGRSGAGIGGGEWGDGGDITISGGTVNAQGGKQGAGIGGGNGGEGGTIAIGGGTVNAQGGNYAAGIGGGNRGDGGSIAINGGEVTAMGGKGGSGIMGGAGTGGGGDGDNGIIIISDGTVTATGRDGSAGIGGGDMGNGGTIAISGGTVKAMGSGGAGIGGGTGGDSSFSTDTSASTPGNGVIFAVPSIGDKTGKDNWNGVIFEEKSGALYGDVTLGGDLTIPGGYTLTIPNGNTLTVSDGVTLKNEGTLTNGGDIALEGSGKLEGTDPDASGGGTVTQIPLTGTVGISGALKYGQTLTVTLSNSNNKGTLSYQWKRGGSDLGIGTTYTTVEADIGQTLTCEVKSTVQTGSVSGSTTSTIAKADGLLAPGVTFSFSDGASKNKLMGATALMEYSLDSGTTWVVCAANHDLTGSLASITVSQGIQIRVAATTTQLAGAARTIAITKADTPDLSPVQPGVIGGKGTIPMTAIHEYKAKDAAQWMGATGDTALAAGTYLVRVKAAGTALASGAQEIVLVPFTGTPEQKPNAVFAATGEAGGTLTAVTTAMKYSVDGGGTWAAITGTTMAIGGVTAEKGVQIYTPGNGTTTTDGPVQTIAVTVAGGVGEGITATGCTNSGNNDGILKGVTAAMEYRAEGASSWVSGTGSDVTGLTAGDYQVRVKAAGTVLAGAVSSYTVAHYIAPPPDNAPKTSYTVSNGTVAVSRSNLQRLASGGKSLTINGDAGALTFDATALKAILSATSGAVTFGISAADIGGFPGAKALIGDRLALDFTVMTKRDGKDVAVPVDFGGGKVTLEIKYTPAKAEESGGLYVVYVDSRGNATRVEQSRYDSEKKAMVFDVSHFSIYGVAFDAPAPAFTDTQNHWAEQAIAYVAGRGILTGTSATTFGPDDTMTRGMLLTALHRMSGKATDQTGETWYSAAMAWAQAEGISDGTSPDAPVTREQLAAMLYRYEQKNGGGFQDDWMYLLPFSDKADISPWAFEAVAWCNMKGIMTGKDGNRLDPKGRATRAETAVMLMRFLQRQAQ